MDYFGVGEEIFERELLNHVILAVATLLALALNRMKASLLALLAYSLARWLACFCVLHSVIFKVVQKR